MASWKEKGVVPDSDEEEEQDSQSLSDEGQPRNASQDSKKDQESQTGGRKEGLENLEQATLPQSPLESGSVDILATVLSGRLTSYPSSPPPRVFEHLPALLSSQTLPSLRDLQSEDQSRVEEISRSYVTLSSPLSSLPSSPLQSPGSQAEEASKKIDPPWKGSETDPFAEVRGIGDSSHDFQPIKRRSLRERNPIQLHPYALEGEKYRRTLLARGMRPLRLENTQNAMRTQVQLEASPDPEFVSEESQGLVFEDGLHSSQICSPESAPSMSNTVPKDSNSLNAIVQSDDDEFPELSKVLTLPRGTRDSRGSTNKIITYGSRFRSKKDLRLTESRISLGQSHLSAFVDASQRPVSPPVTSSPMPVFDVPSTGHHRRGATSYITSCSSTPVEGAAHDLDELTGNLPTPATDPVKQTVVDLTTDDWHGNDPFASDTDSEASSLLFDDVQSIQVRHVAKKMRGVLPASWLRLDQKTQKSKGRGNSSREYRSPSPVKAVNQRGVAVRRHVTGPKILGEIRLENESDFMSDDIDRDDDLHTTWSLVDDPFHAQTSRIAAATSNNPKSASVTLNRPPAKSRGRTSFLKPRKKNSRTAVSTTRPAQLETPLLEHGDRHPIVAFGSGKKTLDTLYKRSHRGYALRGDVQLARFLGHDSGTQVERALRLVPGYEKPTVSTVQAEPRRPRPRQKQVPPRTDVNAAVFRQPSEPLILELLQAQPEATGRFSNAGKLAGLSGFGTAYTSHFDIFSLQEGVFFHESTFIGGGRLQKALEIQSDHDIAVKQGHLLHRIGDQNLRWGPWNATVSSELGLCFDWVVEHIEIAGHEISTIGATDILGSINFIIDYTQGALTFPNEMERTHCLCRFIEVLKIFVERLKTLAESQNVEKPIFLQLLVELSAFALIVAFQLLQLSRLDPLKPEISHQLEYILQNIAAQAVALLLSEGLDGIRKLYDDLQYLSMREGGIKTDRYAAHSWVVIIHVLQAAQVPQLSFWDVVNQGIFAIHNVESKDAKVLERIWYSMFSLLPLFDFDRSGVVVCHRKRASPTTNWALPQRLLKIVFELYATKSRQSTSFNDYLRALFNRCSHLIQAWGWRKHGQIVGTLFDFFANHNLAHIRNEEVYESPRFLGELHRNPHLEIERDDRCFHILLKIIATSIQQMYASKDVKGIRNIVTRVLPNHDRQYPKEQTIHQRDLASLRNHHDLLCTLFWAAPPDLRPDLGLIRRLIDPASSHREAYLIHLRAWHNLARFVLASTPTREAYLPLNAWQFDCFSQLILQYQSAEKDVKQQLRQLSSSAKQLVSEETMAQVINNNQNHVLSVMLLIMKQREDMITTAPTMAMAKLIFLNETEPELLFTIFTSFTQRRESGVSLVESLLDIINAYIRKLNEFVPPAAQSSSHVEEDSQDYGSDVWSVIDSPRLEYTGELNGKIFTGVVGLLQTALRVDAPSLELTDKIVCTWANIASALIMSNLHTLSDYIGDSGMYNEISMDDESHNVRRYYGRFLAALAEVMRERLNLQETGRDAISDWLSFVVRPAKSLYYGDIIFPYFASSDPILERIVPELIREGGYGFRTSEKAREVTILAILREMRKELDATPSYKTRFQGICHRVLASIKREVRDLDPSTPEAKAYESVVKMILTCLTTYFRDICPIDEFFKAAHLYPADDAPEIITPTLRSYALRLNTSRGKSELNHYCFGLAKHAAVQEGLRGMTVSFLCAMSTSEQWAELVEHYLTVLTPAFSHPAFVSECGWLLAEPFLAVASLQLDSVIMQDKSSALRGARAIASTLINGIWILSLTYENVDIRLASGQVPLSAAYTLLLATKFMTRVLKWIAWTDGERSESREGLMDCLMLFNQFALGARDYLMSPIRAYVKAMIESRGGSNDWDITKGLIKSFTVFGPEMLPEDSPQQELQQSAMTALIDHITCPDDDINQVIEDIFVHNGAEIEGVRYKRDSALFDRLREAANTNEGKRWLKAAPSKEMPEFSAVILQDMHEHWRAEPESPEIQINLGREMRHVPVEENCFGQATYSQLLKELEIFMSDYQRIVLSSGRPTRQYRRLARQGIDFDETPF